MNRPNHPFSSSARAVLVASALLVAAFVAPARAEFQRSFDFASESLRVGNLIGAITVEGHDGSGFLVEVDVRGEDATEDLLDFRTDDGRTASLMIVFPEDERRYVYPELGRNSRSSFSRNRGDRGGWWGELFGRNKIEVRGSGRGLEVWADVTIKVPRGAELFVLNGCGEIVAERVDGHLELGVRSGHVTATGIDGSLVADTGSGHVEVDGVRGNLLADTGSGHVDAVDVEGEKITIDTGSGHVRLTDARAPEIEVDTGSGNVDLDRVVGRELVVDTGSGSVEMLDVEADDVEVDTGSGSVRCELVRMGGGDFVIDTGSGSITFLMPEGASAHVEADTGSGGIDIDVVGADMIRDKRDHAEFEVGGGGARVTLDTGSGGIRIAMR